MYLTNEKKLNVSLSGLFYTRKWNDHVPCIYFEKIIGKKSLLKKIYKKLQTPTLKISKKFFQKKKKRLFKYE